MKVEEARSDIADKPQENEDSCETSHDTSDEALPWVQGVHGVHLTKGAMSAKGSFTDPPQRREWGG